MAKKKSATKSTGAKTAAAKTKATGNKSTLVAFAINNVQCNCSLGMCNVTADGQLVRPAPTAELHPGSYCAYEIWDTTTNTRTGFGQVLVNPDLTWSLYDTTPGTTSGGSYKLMLKPQWRLVFETTEEKDFSC